MSKLSRLGKTQQAVQHCVDKAENSKNQVVKQCQIKQKSIDSLNEYQAMYRQQLTESGLQGISASQLQCMGNFIHHLGNAVILEKKQLTSLEDLVHEKQKQLTVQQVKKTAVDNLSARYSHQQQLAAERDEQSQVDELSVASRARHK